jgi:hypothetical protein
MIDACDFPDNEPHVVDVPEARTCKRCGTTYAQVRVFPLKVKCSKLRKFGLGDIVAKAIKLFTFGRVKQTPKCGCKSRQQTLNELWSMWEK